MCDLAGQALKPEACARISRDFRNKLYQRLQQRERSIFKSEGKIFIDKNDIDYIDQDVWKCRSALSGIRMGGPHSVCLTRWDATKPASPQNLILCTLDEANQLFSGGAAVFGEQIENAVNKRLAALGSDW